MDSSMPTMPAPTVPLSLRITPEQFLALDEKARAEGVSRTKLVRRVIAQAVASATHAQDQAA